MTCGPRGLCGLHLWSVSAPALLWTSAEVLHVPSESESEG